MRYLHSFRRFTITLATLIKSRLKPVMVFTLAGATGIALASLNNSFSFMLSFLLLLTWFLASTGVYLLNDIFDVDIDNENDIDRPLTEGKAKAEETKVIVTSLLLTSLILAMLINLETFFITSAFIFFGVIYSVPPIYLKKKPGGKQFTLTIFAALSIFAGATALKSYPVELFYVVLLITPYMSISSILADLKDLEGDRKMGCKTIAISLGPERAIKIAVIGPLTVLALATIGYLYLHFNVLFLLAIAILCGINLKVFLSSAFNSNLLGKEDFRKIDKLGKISASLFQLSIIIGVLF